MRSLRRASPPGPAPLRRRRGQSLAELALSLPLLVVLLIGVMELSSLIQRYREIHGAAVDVASFWSLPENQVLTADQVVLEVQDHLSQLGIDPGRVTIRTAVEVDPVTPSLQACVIEVDYQVSPARLTPLPAVVRARAVFPRL